jgi:hypothetical protein
MKRSESMKKIHLNIQDYYTRNAIVLALATSGYSVYVKEKTELAKTIYWIIFEIPDINIKE